MANPTNPHWFPSAAELRQITSYAQATSSSVTDTAHALCSFPAYRNAPFPKMAQIVRDARA